MSYLHYAQSRLGYRHEDGTVRALKDKYVLADPDNLYLVLRNPKEQGKRVINGGHRVRDIVDFIEEYITHKSDKSQEDYIGFKKRLKMAKSASLFKFKNLRYSDIDIAVQIAQERMPDTYLYIRRHRQSERNEPIDIVLDECISPHLRPLFESELTEVWPISGGNTEGLKDKDVLKLAGRGILITEDDDFVNAIRVIYAERVRTAGSSCVYMGDLPFIVHIESASHKSAQASFASKARKMMREVVEQYSEEYDVSLKADRRMLRTQISRSASKDFADTFSNAIQYKKFQTHRAEIIRLADHEDKPHLGITIRANGNVDYTLSRDNVMDRYFRPVSEDVWDTIVSHKLDEWAGQKVVIIDNQPKLYAEKADGRTAQAVLEKISLIGDEADALIGSAYVHNDASRKRYGRGQSNARQLKR